MSIFAYRARNKDGVLLTGTFEAANVSIVAKDLRSLGYSIVSIDEASRWKDFYNDLSQRIRGVRYQEIVFFTRQLAALLASGIPLDAALDSLSKQVKNTQFREIIKQVLNDVESGLSFSDALEKHPHVFTQVYTSMIRVAETAGLLDKILDRLAELGLRDLEIGMRVRSALTYPVILVTLAIGVVSYLLAAVVPRFVVIFSTYGFKLPLATRILLNISLIARYLWFAVTIVLFVGIFSLRRWLRTPQGRYKMDAFILKIPTLGTFYLKINLANLSRTLSVLINSGIPILEALSVTQGTIRNAAINKVIQDIRVSIGEGKSMVEPFATSGIFPPMVIQMLSAGERTGRVDQMLGEVANFYDREIEYAIRNFSSVLEPILLLIMGFMVAFIALAILSPIFNLINAFRH